MLINSFLVLRNKSIVHIFLIVVLGFIVYSNTFHAPFTFDDERNIVRNDVIKNLTNFFFSSSGYHSDPKRFIGYLTFALNYRFGDIDVTGYHILNLGIHVANALLVYTLLLLTFRTPYLRSSSVTPFSKWIALFVGILFVVHPLQTQAVTYIIQRFASLATMFYLIALVLYVKMRLLQNSVSPSNWKIFPLYFLSLVAIILSMKTKEIAFTLPIMIVLYDFFFFKQINRKNLLILIPIILTLFIIPASFINIQKPAEEVVYYNVGEVTKDSAFIPRMDYLLTQIRVVTTYIRLLFFPLKQNLDYDYPIYHSFFIPEIFLSFLLLLGLFAIAVFMFIKWQKGSDSIFLLIAYGILWFFITLSVESILVPVGSGGSVYGEVISEHRAYLPSIGVFIAFSTFIFVIKKKLKTSIPAGAVAIMLCLAAGVVAFAVATYARNNLWKNEISLWKDVVRKSPAKPRPYNRLGIAYYKNGFLEDAIREYQTAIRIQPDYFDAHNNLGVVYLKLGRVQEGTRELKAAYAKGHYDLGLAYLRKGQLEEALREFQTTVDGLPEHIDAHVKLGLIYGEKGRFGQAVQEFQRAIKLNPGLAEPFYYLGKARIELGHLDEAAESFGTAIKLKPKEADFHYDLGVVYLMQGRLKEAKEKFQTVIRLNRHHEGAIKNIEMITGSGAK